IVSALLISFIYIQNIPITAMSGGAERVQVIIRARGKSLKRLKELGALRGGIVKKEFKMVGGIVMELPAGSISGMKTDPEIESISPDRETFPLMDVTAQTVGANAAWESFDVDGSGIGVAIIDSGINDHEDLTSNKNNGS